MIKMNIAMKCCHTDAPCHWNFNTSLIYEMVKIIQFLY